MSTSMPGNDPSHRSGIGNDSGHTVSTTNSQNGNHAGAIRREEADVVVAGGGLAGTFAAISAARLGRRTILIQDRPVLGGNASSELTVGIAGADCSGSSWAAYMRESGLVDEFALERLRRSSGLASGMPLVSVILWEMTQAEPNLTVHLNTSLRSAATGPDGRILSVRACQSSTERDYEITGKIFIDCTGHGTLGAAAGADFRMGREARSEFGEAMAPLEADRGTMGDSLIFRARDMGVPVPFRAPAWAHRFPTDQDLPFRHPKPEKMDYRFPEEIVGYWWIEYGGQRHTIEDAEEIHDELLRVLWGVWDHMKNTGDHGVANYDITWVSPYPSRRESRRLMGEHILTENEIRQRVLFEDRVAYSGWMIDLHPPQGIYAPERPCTHDRLTSPCSIPYRTLYSRNVPNLFFAGRNISVTHVALGTVRVMATCGIMGQAVGTAAALCCRHNIGPAELGRRHLANLQQRLLRDDCYLVGLRNGDANDLARAAQVSATSEAALPVAQHEEWMALAHPVAQMIPVTASRIDRVELFLRSELPGEQRVTLGLRAADHLNDFTAGQDLAQAEAVIPPGEAGWVRFELGATVAPGRLYWLHLPAMPGVAWGAQIPLQLGTNRGAFDAVAGMWRPWRPTQLRVGPRGTLMVRLTPESHPYAAANVIDGVARPERWTHAWMSDPAQPLPQALDLMWHHRQEIASVQVTFDDDLDSNIYHPPAWGRLGTGLMPTLVRDYRILARQGAQWVILASVQDNGQRRRVHRFAPVHTEALRLECLATHGAPEARVFEVRVYGPEAGPNAT